MNRILITLIILLIISISPANTVQIKETNTETSYLDEIYSYLLESVKDIEIPSYLLKPVKNIPVKKEIRKINHQIDEIDTNSLIELFGESHPITQKIIYLKGNKPKNFADIIQLLPSLIETAQLLNKDLQNQNKETETGKIEEIKETLQKDIVRYELILTITEILLLICGVVILVISGFLGIMVGIEIILSLGNCSPPNAFWREVELLAGKTLIAVCTFYAALLYSYSQLENKKEKLQEKLKKIETQILKLQQETKNNTNNTTTTPTPINNTTNTTIFMEKPPCII